MQTTNEKTNELLGVSSSNEAYNNLKAQQLLKLEAFVKENGSILRLDEHSNYYVKIPIDSYTQIQLYLYYLNKAINYTSQAIEWEDDADTVGLTIRHLSELLECFNFSYECEYLDDQFLTT